VRCLEIELAVVENAVKVVSGVFQSDGTMAVETIYFFMWRTGDQPYFHAVHLVLLFCLGW
jgi:hypothetical protein